MGHSLVCTVLMVYTRCTCDFNNFLISSFSPEYKHLAAFQGDYYFQAPGHYGLVITSATQLLHILLAISTYLVTNRANGSDLGSEV